MATTAIVACLTIASIDCFVRRLFKKAASPEVYSDEDGTATEESQQAASNKIQRFFVFFFSVIGFGASLSLTILKTKSSVEFALAPWLRFVIWVSLNT